MLHEGVLVSVNLGEYKTVRTSQADWSTKQLTCQKSNENETAHMPKIEWNTKQPIRSSPGGTRSCPHHHVMSKAQCAKLPTRPKSNGTRNCPDVQIRTEHETDHTERNTEQYAHSKSNGTRNCSQDQNGTECETTRTRKVEWNVHNQATPLRCTDKLYP